MSVSRCDVAMKIDTDKLVSHKVIPPPRWVPLNLNELWSYRQLLRIFVWRDIKARYKQTVAGVTWVIIQPLVAMVVFSLFFGRWLGISSGDIPYPIFTFCALVPWTYFVHALTVSSTSVVGQQSVITKVYFPRLLMPLSAVLSGLVDLFAGLLVLIPLMMFYGLMPSWKLIFLPLFILLALLTAMSVGVWLAAINVRFRDVNHAMPFVTQLWMFCTPVAYPLSVVPENLRPIYELNPMVAVVEGFRWAVAGQGELPLRMMSVSVCAMLVVLIAGLYWFRHEEVGFADVV
jgi:lipopolysaccharide transport system permease protein